MGYKSKKAEKRELYENYSDFDSFVKNVKIPEKYWKFFEYFINRDCETFGNVLRSYIKAGYKENSTTPYRAKALYDSPLVQKLLTLYRLKTAEKRENADISVFDRTDNDLLWCLERAKLSGDYAAVRAVCMDRAKLHGILVDRHQVIDPITEAEIDRTKALEAAKLAESRLLESPADSDIIDADFIPENTPESTDCTADLYSTDEEPALFAQN
jgi:hypothetical protein